MREIIKKALDGYMYDHHYFEEKSIEIESVKDEIQKSISRLRLLKDNILENKYLEKRINYLIEKGNQEEEILLSILTKKQKIEKIIQKLPQPECTIMYMRYIRFFTFDKIAGKMNYSTKRIYQLHAKAIDLFIAIYVSDQEDIFKV